ncbi:hypothetical protein C0J52_27117 [Blattella germanica]|nr:hypothetical protein C0J52_27117 [Blattella germanica]
MSRYGRDTDKLVFSFMDDVPVKISEQFKPPRKVTLPISFQHRLSNETITERYDFKLEKSVLEKMVEWRKLRRTAVENRRERIKAQEWASAKLQDSAVATTSQSSVSPVPSPFSAVESSSGPFPSSSETISYPDPSPVFTQSTLCSAETLTPALQNITVSNSSTTSTPQYSILTPVPIALPSTGTVTNEISAHFNFSDFEADTSSPFDNMELKTINDMEELAHVLQPLSNPPNQIKQKPPDSVESLRNSYSNPTTVYNADQVAACNTFDSKLKKYPEVQPHINGLTGYALYSTGPRIKQSGRNNEFIPVESRPYDYTFAGIALKSDNPFCYYPERTWSGDMRTGGLVDTSYTLNSTNITSNSVTSDASAMVQQPHLGCSTIHQPVMAERSGYATIHHPPLTYGASFPSTCNSNQDQHSPGRSLSKSVPDIVQELEKELKNKQTEETISSAGRSSKVPPRSKLPNPFLDLSPKAKALVKHISEMGFALPRVARACQLLGEDDKKIVEFLLQVQSLEEKNYPGDRVEKALIVNRYNVDHAIKYLDALAQLLDLGFPEDHVSDALVMFNNDRDKALDKLIS